MRQSTSRPRMVPGEHAWNGSCQLIRQKIECRHFYWLNEPTMNKHPEFVSLGSLSLQHSSAKHQLLEPYISLTQPHKPSTLVFPGLWRNAGALEVSHPAKCLLAGERTCQRPEGGRWLQEPSNWPPLPQHCPHFRASSTEPWADLWEGVN